MRSRNFSMYFSTFGYALSDNKRQGTEIVACRLNPDENRVYNLTVRIDTIFVRSCSRARPPINPRLEPFHAFSWEPEGTKRNREEPKGNWGKDSPAGRPHPKNRSVYCSRACDLYEPSLRRVGCWTFPVECSTLAQRKSVFRPESVGENASSASTCTNLHQLAPSCVSCGKKIGTTTFFDN